jgi:hypothetical protein
MKLIADIGTNPELVKIDATDVLLFHFLKHYDNMGVTDFILHGNKAVIDMAKSNYQNSYNINFVSISEEEFLNYKKRDCDLYNRLKELDQLNMHNQQTPYKEICPLWIIQNDLKKRYIMKNELCFILDLDEFVDLSSVGLKAIRGSDIDFCKGVLRDRSGESSEDFITLKKQLNIFEQLNQTVDITKSSGRAVNKIIITRGHLEHCYGHHDLYNKNDHHKKSWKNILNVDHCKYFKQNIEGGLGAHSKKERNYLNNKYDK